MKVRVSFTVDIDPEAWAREYGVDPDPKAIREDVRSYVENGAQDHLRELGLQAD